LKNNLSTYFRFCLYTVILILLGITPIYGQVRVKIDSLNTLINAHDLQRKAAKRKVQTIADSSKVNALYSLAKIYWGVDLDAATIYENQIIDLSKKIGYKKGEGFGYNILGIVYNY
jgi:hypothetical protein